MFVAKSERGRGLGDVLLFETLNRRCKAFPRSHLYVSSRNTTAVAIYNKFGFIQSDKHSGDISHDLVLEMANTKKCVNEAAKRLKDKFTYGVPVKFPSACLLFLAARFALNLCELVCRQ